MVDVFQTHQLNDEAPNFHILDEKCSADINTPFKDHQLSFKLVPPNVHHLNTVQRVMHIFNNDLVTVLCIYEPNLMRYTRINDVPNLR